MNFLTQPKQIAFWVFGQILFIVLFQFLVTGGKSEGIRQLEQRNLNLVAQIQALTSEVEFLPEENLEQMIEQETLLQTELSQVFRQLSSTVPEEFLVPSGEDPLKFFLNILNEYTKSLRRKIPIHSDLLGFSSEIPAEQDVPILLRLLAMATEVVEQAHRSQILRIEQMRPSYRPSKEREDDEKRFLTTFEYQFEMVGEVRAILDFLHQIQTPKKYYGLRDAEVTELKEKKGFLRLKVVLSQPYLQENIPLPLQEIEEEISPKQPQIRRY